MEENFSSIVAAGDRTPAAFWLFSLLAFSIAFILKKSDAKLDRGPMSGPVPSRGKPKRILPPAFIDELWRIS
jgi:hypothetical protein